MFQKFQRHAREGTGKFQVTHDYECATMRVLEGSTILVNVENLRMKNDRSSPTSSSPSSYNSGSPDETRKNSLPRPGEPNGAFNGNGNSAGAAPEFHMVDLNGVYYPGLAPPSGINQLTPSMMYENINGIQPETPHAGPSSQPMDYAQAHPSHNSAQFAPPTAAGQNYGYHQSLNNYGALSMQDNVMPPYGAPGMQYEPIPGQAELYALQTGGFGMGLPMENMSDQGQWERMLTDMGPSTSHVRVNGGSSGSYHTPTSV